MASPIPYVRSLMIAGFGGSLAVAAGVAVWIGWVTGNTTLRQVRADWVSMVPMTATAFVLSGAALLAITVAMSQRREGEPVAAHF